MAGRWVSAGELRLTLLSGFLLGLVYLQYDQGWSGDAYPPAEISLPRTYPEAWQQSEISRKTLEEQEGAPATSIGVEPGRAPELKRGAVAIRVIDGDTFRYAGETIRIADIDTPETHPPRFAEEAALGARATRRLEALLAQGPFELHPADRDEDRYGRKLRVVVRDGQSLGGVLVAEGLGREWTGRRMPWCA